MQVLTRHNATMSKHPAPTHQDVTAALAAAGVDDASAAALLLVDKRTVQKWCYGERKMPPGMWLLLQIKLERLAAGREAYGVARAVTPRE